MQGEVRTELAVSEAGKAHVWHVSIKCLPSLFNVVRIITLDKALKYVTRFML